MKLKDFLSRYKGRLAGSLFGILAGPFGIALGFLIGYLVDRIFASGTMHEKVLVFLRCPDASRLPGNEKGKYSFFCLLSAVCLASQGSLRMEERLFLYLENFFPCDKNDEDYLKILLEEIDGFDAAWDIRAHAAEVRRLHESLPDGRLRELYAGLLSFASELNNPVLMILKLVAQAWDIPSGIEEVVLPLQEDPYRILGLGHDAGKNEVKKVFRMLATQFHPDGGFALSYIQLRETEEAFRRIREAYERIMQNSS